MEEKLTHIINERIPTTLSTSDFFYALPEELIAQSPSPERDGCRLMILDRGKDHVEHRVFHDIIDYLKHLPSHILINVEGISYYLVHGFPGETMENEVRFRPRLHEMNPVENTRLIIGHTPVLNLMVPKEEQQEFINFLARRGERPRILFAKGFIDIDCGCSYAEPMKTLGCLRLNDLAEYYTYHKQNIIDLTYDVKKSAV